MIYLTGVYTIWLRDLIRFWRDRARIFGSIMQPTLYLFILGTGLSAALGRGQAAAYVKFIFPGIIGMSLLFTSIFSAVSIIWDREFGFLKEVLVAPIPRASVAIGKALGGATVATLQAALILVYAPIIGVSIGFLTVVKIIPVMLLISFSLTSLGVVVAARMKSMEGFQVIMNFLLMPMFFLSGAMFPLKGLPGWLTGLTRFDPLTYGVDALRNIFFAKAGTSPAAFLNSGKIPVGLGGIIETRTGLFEPLFPLWLDIAVIFFFGLVMILVAVKQFQHQD